MSDSREQWGHPSRVSRLQFWNRSLTGFPGANIIQYCSRKEVRGGKRNVKCQSSNDKVQIERSLGERKNEL